MIKKVLLTINFLILFLYIFSQAPGHVPYGKPEPVDFDLFNIILLIVLPVLLIIIYIFQRKKNRRNKK